MSAHPHAAPIGVPSLDELARHPELVAELPATVAADLLGPCEAELGRMHTLRDMLLVRAAVGAHGAGDQAPTAADRLLTVEEASKQLSTTRDWLYRHAGGLPFTMRNGR